MEKFAPAVTIPSSHCGPQTIACGLTWTCITVLLWTLLNGCGPTTEQTDGANAATASAPQPTALPDLRSIADVKTKKQLFFDFLGPLVIEENNRILAQRQRLERQLAALRSGQPPKPDERLWLEQLASHYEIPDAAFNREDSYTRLLGRVDIIPPDLALIQAANESGWGTSRFARQGNNLFGHWCFTAGCGMVPKRRAQGARHEVAIFPSVQASVRNYIHNLNTGAAYRELRAYRRRQRLAGQTPDAHTLVAGLEKYSTRRQRYVADLRTMLHTNASLLRPHAAARSVHAAGELSN